MPLIVVRTTVALTDEQIGVISKELTEHIAALVGKPTGVFMIDVQPSQKITFALSTEPAAHVAVNIIGDPKQEGNDKICGIIAAILAPHGIPTGRTFVTFQIYEDTHWGFGGTTVKTFFSEQ